MTIFYIALPTALAIFGNLRKWSLVKLVFLGVMSIAVTSGFILYESESRWRAREEKLYAYENDGNGSSPEAIELREALTADTGRGMGPVIKGFMATVHTLVSFFLVSIVFKIATSKEDRTDESESCNQPIGTANKQVEPDSST